MSKTFRRAAMSTICMLIVAVMSLTGATYAWFTTGTEATVTGFEMDVSAAEGGIQVSTDAEVWANQITLNVDKNEIVPVSTAIPVADASSGAWGLPFFTAELNPANNNQIKTVKNVGDNYILQTLYLKNTSKETPVTINLTDTNIAALAIGEGENAVTRYAVYASRLAVLNLGTYALTANSAADVTAIKDLNNDPTGASGSYFIYEPYSTNRVDANAATGTLGYKGVIAETGVYADDYETVDLRGKDRYIDIDGNDSALASVTTKTDLGACTLTIPADSVMKIQVYVWLEGQDVDCINEVALSNMSISLKFNKVD